ncbi:PAS domain-containing protein [Terrihabitans soli]|uniref:PAS domain-containing protein n=1 Tax=Terrihabitans soli TaxID=708113 RepID=UPI001CA3580E|nr:PAS domain-containing protein [Terrihabitans soli]
MSAEEFALVEQQCGFGTWSYDLVTCETYCSEGLSSLLGLDPDERADASRVLSILHPEDRPRVEQQWAHLEDQDACALEMRIITPGGTIRRLRSHIHIIFENWVPTKVVGAVFDISELHHERSAAVQSQKQLVDLSRSISPITWTVEPDGAVSLCTSWCSITGMKPQQASQWGWLERVHERHQSALRAAWVGAVRTGKSFAQTILIRDRGDQWVLYAFRAAPIVFRHPDTTLEVSLVCVDIQRCDFTFFPDQTRFVPNGAIDGPESVPVLSGALMRAARGLLDWPAKALAHKAGVSLSTIRRMEMEGDRTHRDLTASLVQKALEKAGVEFLPLPDGSTAIKLADSKSAHTDKKSDAN